MAVGRAVSLFPSPGAMLRGLERRWGERGACGVPFWDSGVLTVLAPCPYQRRGLLQLARVCQSWSPEAPAAPTQQSEEQRFVVGQRLAGSSCRIRDVPVVAVERNAGEAQGSARNTVTAAGAGAGAGTSGTRDMAEETSQRGIIALLWKSQPGA